MNLSYNDELSVSLSDDDAEILKGSSIAKGFEILGAKFAIVGIAIDVSKPISLKKVDGEYRVFVSELKKEGSCLAN